MGARRSELAEPVIVDRLSVNCLPAWQPGDEQSRTIRPSHAEKWDFAVIDAEAEIRPNGKFCATGIPLASRSQAFEHARDPHRRSPLSA
jgi:hypothetical protein